MAIKARVKEQKEEEGKKEEEVNQYRTSRALLQIKDMGGGGGGGAKSGQSAIRPEVVLSFEAMARLSKSREPDRARSKLFVVLIVWGR